MQIICRSRPADSTYKWFARPMLDLQALLVFCTSSGDIPENNPRECHFLPKKGQKEKLPNFLSNFQHYFRNVLQHLTEVFRPYDPCKKSLEIDSQPSKKKFSAFFAFFSRFLGVYFYKASWLVNTCWLNVDKSSTFKKSEVSAFYSRVGCLFMISHCKVIVLWNHVKFCCFIRILKQC